MKKSSKGFSLLEAVIAIAVWMVLSVSVLFVWHHISERSTELLARQSAFENARVALDALLINTEMAHIIRLTSRRDGTLQRLVLYQRNPDGIINDFIFTFNVNAQPGNQRLNFGGQELAGDIARIYVMPIGTRLHITVITTCEYPIVLEGSVDIRYKTLR